MSGAIGFAEQVLLSIRLRSDVGINLKVEGIKRWEKAIKIA